MGRRYEGDTPSEIGFILDQIEALQSRIRTLEAPDGAQLAQVVEQLRLLVEDLSAQVDDLVNTKTYLRSEIDTRIANPPAGSAVTGNVSATGSITAGTTLRGDGGIYSLDARNFVVVNNYAASWIDINGHFGISPSSRRFKRDIETWAPDLALLFSKLRAVRFRYELDQPIGFGENDEPILGPHPDPESAPWSYGFIAEELVEAGLQQFTFADEDGRVLGINYDRITVALFSVAQHQAGRLDDIERRLDEAGL